MVFRRPEHSPVFTSMLCHIEVNRDPHMVLACSFTTQLLAIRWWDSCLDKNFHFRPDKPFCSTNTYIAILLKKIPDQLYAGVPHGSCSSAISCIHFHLQAQFPGHTVSHDVSWSHVLLMRDSTSCKAPWLFLSQEVKSIQTTRLMKYEET